MKKLLISLFCFLFLPHIQAQTTSIKWTFNTKDASFGQTASGDIDHDGKLELVFGCYRNDSCIYALNAEDGKLLWKFNASATMEGCNDVAPILYDINNDDSLEVIVPSSCNPKTFCFNGKSGKIIWQTPTRGSDSPPSIADIDGDKKPEIIHGEFGGYVICLNAEDGSIAWEIPVDVHSWIQTAPSITDLDGDSKPDFVVATWNSTQGDTNKVYAFRGIDHHLLWTFPLKDVVYHGTAIADLDLDAKPELIIGDYSGTLYCLNGENGTLKWKYQCPEYFYIGSPASIADLDGDEHCEIVFSAWYKIYALNDTGGLKWEFNIPEYGSCFRGTAISDIDNDALPDLIFGTSEGDIIAIKGTNNQIIWQKSLSHDYGDTFELDHAPIVADFDNDGSREVFIVGGFTKYPDFYRNYGRAYCLSGGIGNGPDWLMFQKNSIRNSSLCGFQASVNETQDKSTPQIKLKNNSLEICSNSISNLAIYNLDGKLLYENQFPGSENITLPDEIKGMIIIKVIFEDNVLYRLAFIER